MNCYKKFTINPLTFLLSYAFAEIHNSSNLIRSGGLYQSMLKGYKKSMRKPNKSAEDVQVNFLSKALQQNSSLSEEINQKIDYLVKIRTYKLFTIDGLNIIEDFIQKVYPNLSLVYKVKANCVLVEQGRKCLKYNRSEENSGIQNLESMLKAYCKMITNQKIEALENWKGNQVQEILKFSKWQLWQKQIVYVHRAQIAMTNRLEILETQSYSQLFKKIKTRSNLEIQVEALLITLGYIFQKQVRIYGFTVDFLVNVQGKKQGKKCIVQVMGFHHYTVEGRLFGRDEMRCLILKLHSPLAIINADILNPMKQLQSRLKYLKQTIEQALKKSA